MPWVDEMAQRLDFVIVQKFGEFVAALDRQHGGDGVELFSAPLHRGQGCLGFGHGRSKIAGFGGLQDRDLPRFFLICAAKSIYHR